MDPSAAKDLEVALGAARAAGQRLLELFERGVQPEWKGPGDPVTEADYYAEGLVRQHITAAFPDDTVVGEEGAWVDEAAVRGRRRWYVDPVDGTINFLKGRPRWGVAIGLCDERDEVTVGVVHAPAVGETYSAVRGGGAWRDGHRRLIVAPTTRLEEALLLLSTLAREPDRAAADRLVGRALSVLVTGSTVLDLCDVAAGRADGYWTWGSGRWDLAAAGLIAAEAGATVTDLRGDPVTGPATAILAAAPGIHHVLSSVLPQLSATPAPARTGGREDPDDVPNRPTGE